MLIGLVIAGTTPSFAISDEDIYNQLSFNFFNPGGRALGMGGAAVAAVQDSTASLANPGALVNLVKDEFFVEYRGNMFNEDDRSFGDTTDLFTAQSGSRLADTASPTYASYVHPWTTLRNGQFRQWAVSFSRQELVDTERSVQDQELRVEDEAGAGRFFTSTAEGNVDLDVVQYNVGFAGQLTSNFSLGLTGTFAEMTLDSVGTSLTRDPFGIFSNVNPRERLDPQTLAFSTLINDENDTAVTGSLGLFWQPNSFYSGDVPPPIKLGLSYNRGPEFEVPIDVLDASGLSVNEDRMFVLKVPDRYGVGFAYEILSGARLQNRFTWTADVVWVGYADLLEGFENNLNTFTRTGREIAGEQVAIDFDIDDGFELRGGFEWSRDIGTSWNFGLRTGAARLPANVIFADSITESGGDGVLNPNLEMGLAALYGERDDQNAFSMGFNFAFVGKGLNSIIDVAFQSADDFDQAVVSYMMRF